VIGPGCVLRSGTRLLSGASTDARSAMLEHTLVLAGECVDSGTVWQGWPSKKQIPLLEYRNSVRKMLDDVHRQRRAAYEEAVAANGDCCGLFSSSPATTGVDSLVGSSPVGEDKLSLLESSTLPLSGTMAGKARKSPARAASASGGFDSTANGSGSNSSTGSGSGVSGNPPRHNDSSRNLKHADERRNSFLEQEKLQRTRSNSSSGDLITTSAGGSTTATAGNSVSSSQVPSVKNNGSSSGSGANGSGGGSIAMVTRATTVQPGQGSAGAEKAPLLGGAKKSTYSST
jgi:hypothetical protein